MPGMDSFFTKLGRKVRAQWMQENFSLARFPDIACAALEEEPPAEHVDLASLMKAFLLDDEQPFQTESGFGQPELIVFDDSRFYIQVLFWLDGTTDIHEHTFSGAFHVLEGSSIHSRFVFEDRVPITPHLQLGHLRMIETRLLETGSSTPITSGGTYIHALFHLDTPSLTVVIRTHHDPGVGPQFTYLPPSLAVDPLHHDPLTARRKQLLDVLENVSDASYADLMLQMIAKLDFERGFFMLQNGMGYLRSLERWDEVLAAFQEKHGALAEGVEPTLHETLRRDGLAALRSQITEPAHRFFVALLLNVPTRSTILKLVAERFPGRAEETIVRWASELCEVSERGTWMLDAEFPPELDVPIDEQPETFLTALQDFLNFDTATSTSKNYAELREVLLASSWRPLLIGDPD